MNLLLLLAFFIAPIQAQEDDCIRGQPKPVIDAEAKGVAKHAYKDETDREARETVTLKDGLHFIVRHYGCAHYGLTFEFKTKGPKAKDGRGLLKEAAALLDRLAKADPKSYGRKFSDVLMKALEQPSYSPGEAIVITEGYSWLSVEEETDSKGRRWIKAAYDIAL